MSNKQDELKEALLDELSRLRNRIAAIKTLLGDDFPKSPSLAPQGEKEKPVTYDDIADYLRKEQTVKSTAELTKIFGNGITAQLEMGRTKHVFKTDVKHGKNANGDVTYWGLSHWFKMGGELHQAYASTTLKKEEVKNYTAFTHRNNRTGHGQKRQAIFDTMKGIGMFLKAPDIANLMDAKSTANVGTMLSSLGASGLVSSIKIGGNNKNTWWGLNEWILDGNPNPEFVNEDLKKQLETVKESRDYIEVKIYNKVKTLQY